MTTVAHWILHLDKTGGVQVYGTRLALERVWTMGDRIDSSRRLGFRP
jgi:hypothetical protein